MEHLSLGTKSTRHEIINKLYFRKYITLSPLAPTLLAIAVVDALEDCDVVKPKMTAVLEKDMDLISEGKKTLKETIGESRKMLTAVMMELEKDVLETTLERLKKRLLDCRTSEGFWEGYLSANLLMPSRSSQSVTSRLGR